MSCEPQKKTHDDSTDKIKDLAERLKKAWEKADRLSDQYFNLDRCFDFDTGLEKNTQHCLDLHEESINAKLDAFELEWELEDALNENLEDLGNFFKCLHDAAHDKHPPVA
jgi:hypothetical protein